MNDTEIVDWLNGALTYYHMIMIFDKEIGLASDGGPRDIRAAVEMAAAKEDQR